MRHAIAFLEASAARLRAQLRDLGAYARSFDAKTFCRECGSEAETWEIDPSDPDRIMCRMCTYQTYKV